MVFRRIRHLGACNLVAFYFVYLFSLSRFFSVSIVAAPHISSYIYYQCRDLLLVHTFADRFVHYGSRHITGGLP